MISIKEAEEVLKKEYVRDNYIYLVKEILLPDYRADLHSVVYTSKVFSSVVFLGSSELCDVSVFEVELAPNVQNRRVGITQEMFKILRELRISNAIISFVNSDYRNYRLSLLTSKYEIEDGRIIKILSNPRRFSYSLGYGTKTKTAYDFLIAKGKSNNLEELIDRFSVEIVNKHFYAQIASMFTKLVGGESNGVTYKRLLNINLVEDHNVYSEFAVRLIGRIMFCWFLKEKKSEQNKPLVYEDLLSVKTIRDSKNYYHDVLEPLFYELLNTNIALRKKYYQKEYYNNIPYLNGGLFSPQQNDYYRYDVESGGGVYGKVTIPNQWFIDLYSILSQYNFTVDENTAYDIELSIDPEMLGRIFENLLAEINPETEENAKKNSGSFYTTRDIVDYMVDSCLLDYLANKTQIEINKLKSILSYTKQEDEIVISQKEKKKIVDALYTVTILDPACGSGAFPIGMLQKIVYILQEIDPDANMWFDKATENVSVFLKKEFEKKFNNGSLNYIRKLSVIQNSIFGIDIQPIAVEISRLRCFLSLIIEEKVEDEEENRGINPLPNLDFKFIIANSLISLEEASGDLFENIEYVDQLKAVRDEYFNAESGRRAELKLEFANIQQDMLLETINQNAGIASKKYEQLYSWKPFQNVSTEWFDADWMFGIKNGFDIVIGNPPYVDSEAMTKSMPEMREEYARRYSCAKGNWDLYVPFWQRAFQLTNETGRAALITSNKWLAIPYGKELRALLFDHITTISDYTKFYAFSTADVSTVVVMAEKTTCENINVVRFDSGFNMTNEESIIKNVIRPFDNLALCLSSEFDVLYKIMNNERLDASYEINGAATVSETYEIAELVENKPTYETDEYFKFINTGTIKKFSSQWGKEEMTYVKNKYLCPVVSGERLQAMFPHRYDQAIAPKLITTGIRYFKVFGDFEGEYLAAKSTEIITAKETGDIQVILPILNSSVVFFFLKEAYGGIALGGGITFSPDNLSKIPLPTLSDESKNELRKLSKTYSKAFDADKLNELDAYVYQLYNLTETEQEIIEEFKKSFKSKNLV